VTNFESALESQRALFEHAFAVGAPHQGGGQPRVLTTEQYEQGKAIADHGGWTTLDRGIIDAVRRGARPGDAVPGAEVFHLVDGVDEVSARIDGHGDERRVLLFFAHRSFPGVRFCYRSKPPGSDDYELAWLVEELATGALHRMMRYDQPTADKGGVIRTRLYGQLVGKEGENDTSRLVLRGFAHVAAIGAGSTCGIYVAGLDRPGPCGEVAAARAPRSLWDRGVHDASGGPAGIDDLFVGACSEHVEELRRRAAERNGEPEML
jgi:hypothetical protein